MPEITDEAILENVRRLAQDGKMARRESGGKVCIFLDELWKIGATPEQVERLQARVTASVVDYPEPVPVTNPLSGLAQYRTVENLALVFHSDRL